jgi:hypothetical protein
MLTGWSPLYRNPLVELRPPLEGPEIDNGSEAFKERGSGDTSICQDLLVAPSQLLQASTSPSTGKSVRISICRQLLTQQVCRFDQP